METFYLQFRIRFQIRRSQPQKNGYDRFVTNYAKDYLWCVDFNLNNIKNIAGTLSDLKSYILPYRWVVKQNLHHLFSNSRSFEKPFLFKRSSVS